MKRNFKEIPEAILERWISSILKDRSPEELVRLLLDQCTQSQKTDLMDEFKDHLIYEGFHVFKCKTLNEQIKLEDFLDTFKPYYNEREMIF